MMKDENDLEESTATCNCLFSAPQVQAAALASESVLEVLGSQQIVERVRDLENLNAIEHFR